MNDERRAADTISYTSETVSPIREAIAERSDSLSIVAILWAETIMHKNIVCYGLDRMLNLQISAETFLPPANFNLAERLQYCFDFTQRRRAERSNSLF
jgi:hypothetical protein